MEATGQAVVLRSLEVKILFLQNDQYFYFAKKFCFSKYFIITFLFTSLLES